MKASPKILQSSLCVNAVALLVCGISVLMWPDAVWGFFAGDHDERSDDGVLFLASSGSAASLIALSLLLLALSVDPNRGVDDASGAWKARLAHQRIAVASMGAMFAAFVLLDVVALPRSDLRRRALMVHLGVAMCLAFLNAVALLVSFFKQISLLPYSVSGQGRQIRHLKDPLLLHSGSEDGEEGEETNEDVGVHHEATTTSPEKGWSDLLKLAKPQQWWIFVASAVLFLRLPFSLAVPHFVSSILGAVIDGDGSKAQYYTLCLVVVGTMDALLDFWTFFLFGLAQQKLVFKLRVDVFRSILNQEVGFFDSSTAGELSSRLTSDTQEMSSDLTWVFRFTIEALVRIGGIAAYMLWAEWRLALVAFAIVPICAAVGKCYGDWLQHNAKMVQTSLADANSTATEALSNVRTVVLCGTEKSVLQAYTSASERYYTLNVRQTAMQAGYFMVVNTFLVSTVLQASLLLYGSHLCLHEGMHPQVLIAFMLYQGQLQEYTANLVNSLTNLIKSTGAGAKVFGLLERKPRRRDHGGYRPPDDPRDNATYFDGDALSEEVHHEGGEAAMNALRSAYQHLPMSSSAETIASDTKTVSRPSTGCRVALSGVWFSYPTRPKQPILRGLTLTVETGETVALVGASGAGKSTIFHLLCRLYEPASGAVTINRADVASYDPSWLRRATAVVSQEPVLFAGTIEENILYSLSDQAPPRDLLADASSDLRRALRRRAVDAAVAANAAVFIEQLPDG